MSYEYDGYNGKTDDLYSAVSSEPAFLCGGKSRSKPVSVKKAWEADEQRDLNSFGLYLWSMRVWHTADAAPVSIYIDIF